MNRLRTKVGSLELTNPVLLASGMMGETSGSLLRMARSGAGGVVTKSIGSEPRSGYPNPTLVELDEGYVNAMGLPNPGIEAFAQEMREAAGCPVPIIASVFASSPREFAELARRMEGYGARAVELNLSCPHAKGYGMEVGVDPESVAAIVRQVKSECTLPVWAKLTPNTHRLVEVARSVEEAGGDAIVAINTLKAMCIDVEARRPILSNRGGGLSGPAIRPVGVRCVYDLRAALGIPIVGVGGVETWKDALEYIMAGASAVQVGSAIGRKGAGVFKEIQQGISSYMEANDVGSIAELVGAAHE